jgi:putative GTP pyrophosphokinase
LVPDLSGVQSRLIGEEFLVYTADSGDKRDKLAPNQFGYLSVHFIVSFSAERLGLREYRRYKGLKAEIQVRTVVQHAWAATDHKIRYKREEDVPHNVVRELYRCAALLEEADEKFTAVIRQVNQYKADITDKLSRGDLDLEVSFDALDAYVKSSGILKQLVVTAQSLGYCPEEQASAEHYERRLSGARKMCDFLGLTTLQALDIYLTSSSSWSAEWLRDLKKVGGRRQVREGIPPSAEPLSVLRHMLIGHLNPSLTEEQLTQCACRGAVHAHLVQAREKSSAGRPENPINLPS